MKIKIQGHRGRGRSGRPVEPREVSFNPQFRHEILHNRWVPGRPSDPVEWGGENGENIVRGEIHVPKGETIHGHYDLVLQFQDAELKNWLERYAEQHPRKALELISKVLPIVAGVVGDNLDD